MRIILLSDTHNYHGGVILRSDADMIIHAGDISKGGRKYEIEDFLAWYSSLPYKYKIFIAGNHDFFFENRTKEEIAAVIPHNVIYLEDSEYVVVTEEGIRIKIYGSPIQPEFHDWAFNRKRGEEIKGYWDKIPLDTDILVIHGPAHGVLDRVRRDGQLVGCKNLLERIKEIQPKVFVCGHIHEGYGRSNIGKTEVYNASVLNEYYELVNEPFLIEI